MILATAGSDGPSTLTLTLLSVILGGGLLTFIWNVYMRITRGKEDDQEILSRISSQVVEGAHGLLEEYRIEIEVNRRQIAQYMNQVTELNRLLGAANERINNLETRLEATEDARTTVRTQLEEALKQRDELVAEIEKVRQRLSELEHPSD